MEGHFLLLAFEVELARADGENKIRVVLVVYDFKRQATLNINGTVSRNRVVKGIGASYI